jgi:hypothetical protein
MGLTYTIKCNEHFLALRYENVSFVYLGGKLKSVALSNGRGAFHSNPGSNLIPTFRWI